MLLCIISFILIFSFYSLAFVLNMILSLEAVKSSLVGNNYFIAVLFTLLIIVAPEYIFNSLCLKLKTNKKNVFSFLNILGIIFAISFSLISIWGTVETLHKITFGNIVTKEKKLDYEKELSEYTKRKESLLNSIESTRDKILTMPTEYFTIRKQYENILFKFQKELEIFETKKPKLQNDNTNNLSIIKIFDEFGFSINGVKFLFILLILGAFGLELFLIMLSGNLYNIYISLSSGFSKKINISNNIEDCIVIKYTKFILNCLENDNLTIKPLRDIVKEKSIKISKLMNMLKILKENNVVYKNGQRLILHTELATKLVK